MKTVNDTAVSGTLTISDSISHDSAIWTFLSSEYAPNGGYVCPLRLREGHYHIAFTLLILEMLPSKYGSPIVDGHLVADLPSWHFHEETIKDKFYHLNFF
ncbi:MAG: hypothetical protein Q8922_11555 [Bacteroidota bacterium]|nr:hypothetical protein [Bacteroidota bacterium]MDP4234682.1 hypothetical protein [Bacteroidota bacterium]MDP4288562.1 hypothetical protein [Bacteroidota bacterium]